MKLRARFLLILPLTFVLAVMLLSSCSHEEISSEDLFFQGLEQAASGHRKEAAEALADCLERDDEWAAVASEQLLQLYSDYPALPVSQSVLKKAREYHPLKIATLRTEKDYPVTFSAESLSSFNAGLLDEIASSWLSSDIDRRKAADLMAQAAVLKRDMLATPDSKAENWLLNFYAGRLYEKNGSSTWSSALTMYNEARNCSYSDLTYDRSLWYFLELSRRSNARSIASALTRYSASWHDNAYFDDFFDRLASDLLSSYDWTTFYKVFDENQYYMSAAAKAKYAYISARLIETDICTPANAETPEALYQTVFDNAEYGSYYDLLAHYQTGTPFTADSVDETRGSEFAEQLLGGLISHDFPDLTDYYLKTYSSVLSTPVLLDAYTYLLTKQGSERNYLSLTSMALKLARERPGDTRLMKLAFPTYYRTYVETEARRYGLQPWLLYALIHSESCFQADITSVVGANGLTQLMASTAGDVARKLRMTDYDLADPATNIRLGSYYLNELIGRLDGDILLAVFSYNAGITRVRNWKRQAPRLPPDIFLETVPYEETRTYGQKILRASVMYNMLYYDDDQPMDIIADIMDFAY